MCLILSACTIWGDDDSEEDLVAIAQATLTAQATQPTPTSTATTPAQIPLTPTPSSPDERVPNVFDIGWESARLVSVVIELVEAYNAGEIEQVLGLLTDDAGWADCDYEADEDVVLEDKDEIRAWLEERVANHDQLEVARMFNGNPSSDTVLGIEWGPRLSNELRALGFDTGIQPELSSVVSFSRENGQLLIRGFSTTAGTCDLST
jgi:hypothetical protein